MDGMVARGGWDGGRGRRIICGFSDGRKTPRMGHQVQVGHRGADVVREAGVGRRCAGDNA